MQAAAGGLQQGSPAPLQCLHLLQPQADMPVSLSGGPTSQVATPAGFPGQVLVSPDRQVLGAATTARQYLSVIGQRVTGTVEQVSYF